MNKSIFDMDSYGLTVIGSTLSIALILYKKDYVYVKAKKCFSNCIVKYVKLRSDYMWNTRNRLPFIVTRKLDKILKINPEICTVNSSPLTSERISIEECMEISEKGEFITCRKRELNGLKPLLDIKNHLGFIQLNKNQVFRLFGMQESPWYLKITYRGHSNIEKRVPSKKYTVIYKMGDDSPFVFPPYSANEQIKVGFTAPKIKSAKLMTGENVDFNIVQKYAGLRCDFYESSEIEEIVKFYIEHEEDVLVSLKKKNIVVNNEL